MFFALLHKLKYEWESRKVVCVCPVRKRLTVVLKCVRISDYIVLFNK